MDDPAIAIVQTPQFFRDSAAQTWIENSAGAIQEVFYRSIQVARDRFGAAICVGTSAVYRRAALEPQGGPTLIPYAEDVHTGLDVRRAGLDHGLPADRALDRDLPGQPRRLRAPAVPVVHRERRRRVLPPAVVGADDHPRPGSPTSPGFFYYAYTGLLTFFGPSIPVVMLAFLPGQVRLRNFIILLPAMRHRVRPVPAVAPLQVRAVGLAAGHRPGLGARLRHLGQRPGQDDGLASVPDTGQRAAAFPDRGHRVERRHRPCSGWPWPSGGRSTLGSAQFAVLLFFGLLNLAVVAGSSSRGAAAA